MRSTRFVREENVTMTKPNEVRNFLTKKAERSIWAGKVSKIQIGSISKLQNNYTRNCFIKFLVFFSASEMANPFRNPMLWHPLSLAECVECAMSNRPSIDPLALAFRV